jgi:hypothetical protein
MDYDIATGPWEWFAHKANSSAMQKFLVQWLIAMYGLSYPKRVELDVLKQMIVAICDEQHFLRCTMSAQQAADMFPFALTDVAKRVKHAAGLPILYIFVP